MNRLSLGDKAKKGWGAKRGGRAHPRADLLPQMLHPGEDKTVKCLTNARGGCLRLELTEPLRPVPGGICGWNVCPEHSAFNILIMSSRFISTSFPGLFPLGQIKKEKALGTRLRCHCDQQPYFLLHAIFFRQNSGSRPDIIEPFPNIKTTVSANGGREGREAAVFTG